MDLEGVPPNRVHTPTLIHMHTHTHTHKQWCIDLCTKLQSLSYLLRFFLWKTVLVQGLILTPELMDGLTWEGY